MTNRIGIALGRTAVFVDRVFSTIYFAVEGDEWIEVIGPWDF